MDRVWNDESVFKRCEMLNISLSLEFPLSVCLGEAEQACTPTSHNFMLQYFCV